MFMTNNWQTKSSPRPEPLLPSPAPPVPQQLPSSTSPASLTTAIQTKLKSSNTQEYSSPKLLEFDGNPITQS